MNKCCRDFYKWHKLCFIHHFVDEGVEITKVHQIWAHCDDEQGWVELVTIKFCPFCGKQIVKNNEINHTD